MPICYLRFVGAAPLKEIMLLSKVDDPRQEIRLVLGRKRRARTCLVQPSAVFVETITEPIIGSPQCTDEMVFMVTTSL